MVVFVAVFGCPKKEFLAITKIELRREELVWGYRQKKKMARQCRVMEPALMERLVGSEARQEGKG